VHTMECEGVVGDIDGVRKRENGTRRHTLLVMDGKATEGAIRIA
jgi:hypothetical protein